MSQPERCLGCRLEVADDAAWKREHPTDDCSAGCWCRVYCWGDCRVSVSPSDIRARARAEAFEECARIADVEAETHRLRDDPQRMDAARWIAREIRRKAKP